MNQQLLQSLPSSARRQVAELAAAVIELAASFGSGYWGVTPYADGIRINVGWTEILTALPEHIRLIVDGKHARSAALPDGVALDAGKDGRGYYPSVPGSLCGEIPYQPSALLERAIEALHPALMEAVRVAARRRAGRGVKEGHRQEAVLALSSLVGRHLPSPGFAVQSEQNAPSDSTLMEGALRRVVSSEYERNPTARRVCIEHYGASCFVCGFSFELAFGEIGRGFIHVHHIIPLSSAGGEYRVNPVADLRPVCPNCHAMLHCQDPPLTIEELQVHISNASDA